MTGYFVTADDRGRHLCHTTENVYAPECIAHSGDTNPAVFDAAVLLLTEPDNALVRRMAEAMSRADADPAIADMNDIEFHEHMARAALAALREEAGR